MRVPWRHGLKVISHAAALAAAFSGSASAETLASPDDAANKSITESLPGNRQPGPRDATLLALVNAVWSDASTTWQSVFHDSAKDGVIPRINIVPKVTAGHCYGLYNNSGPVYCSGNGTVFVSLDELDKLAQRFATDADATLAFLMAHEFGHHLLMSAGRFRLLSHMIRETPARRREYVMRFELEADCLAGVWAGRSPAFAATQRVKAELLHAIALVGDDKVQIAASSPADPANFWHGTSEQRAHWFYVGEKAGNPDACDVLTAQDF